MFREAPYLSEVNIPNTVTEIGASAFDQCPQLTMQVVPGSYGADYCREKQIPFVTE